MENVSINKEEMLKQRELLETQLFDVVKDITESECSAMQLVEKDGCIPLEQVKDIMNNVDLAINNMQKAIINIYVLLNDQEYINKSSASMVLENFKTLSKILHIASGDLN